MEIALIALGAYAALTATCLALLLALSGRDDRTMRRARHRRRWHHRGA